MLHGYYPQARNPDSSRNSCWIWNSLSSTDGSTMPPHPRADGPHHSSAETSLPRKPSVPESISSGGFEPTTSGVSRDPAPYLTSRPTTHNQHHMAASKPITHGLQKHEGSRCVCGVGQTKTKQAGQLCTCHSIDSQPAISTSRQRGHITSTTWRAASRSLTCCGIMRDPDECVG